MTEKMGGWRLGLVGWPLEHSLSPQIHSAALAALHQKGDYCLIPVPGGKTAGLVHVLDGMRRGDWDGLNVTIPFKEMVMGCLDDLSPAARIMGAVNTVVISGDGLRGENTDAEGFARDLGVGFGEDFLQFAGVALILGAGGAARAAAFALAIRGWKVTLAARRPRQAQGVAASLFHLGSPLDWIPLTKDALMGIQPDLIINATPVGMWPDVRKSPWPPNVPLPVGAALYDLVYNPAETAFLGQGRRAGLACRSGAGMLTAQAALSFEHWTGIWPPLPEMAAALEGALRKKTKGAV